MGYAADVFAGRPMKYSSRFFLYAPLGAFLVVLAVIGVHWWIMASALSDRLAAMNGQEVMPGVTFRYASRRISGFPFSLDTQFHNVVLTVASPNGPTRWRVEKFASHALTYGRNEAIFEAAGHQTLQWTRPDGSMGTLPFAVGSLHASAIVRNGSLARFDLDVVGFGSKPFTAQRIQLHARRRTGNKLEFLASVAAPRPTSNICSGQLDPLSTVELSGAVSHADQFAALLAGRRSWTSTTRQWRGAGGHLQYLFVTLTPKGQSGAKALGAAIHARFSNLPAETLPAIAPLGQALCGPSLGSE